MNRTILLPAAVALAERALSHLEKQVGAPIQIVDDYTELVDGGFLFFYNTREFLTTGNFSAALAGNSPIYVDRTGSVFLLDSSLPWKEALHEKKWMSWLPSED